MDRVRIPGTDIEVSALCLGVAEIGVRQTEIEAHHLLRCGSAEQRLGGCQECGNSIG